MMLMVTQRSWWEEERVPMSLRAEEVDAPLVVVHVTVATMVLLRMWQVMGTQRFLVQ